MFYTSHQILLKFPEGFSIFVSPLFSSRWKKYSFTDFGLVWYKIRNRGHSVRIELIYNGQSSWLIFTT